MYQEKQLEVPLWIGHWIKDKKNGTMCLKTFANDQYSSDLRKLY